MTGRTTLAEVRAELESALTGKSLSPSPVLEALNRVLEAGRRQSASTPVEQPSTEPDNSDSRDQMVEH